MKKLPVIYFLLATTSLLAQEDVYQKEIRKEFSVNAETRLEIINKYGNVDIVNRADPSVTIAVRIKVDARSRERADDLLNMIRIDISQSGDLIRAITELGDDFTRSMRGMGNRESFEINYSISMPATVPLYLENKYGNVFIEDLLANSIIDIKYGKLTANKIIHDSKEPLSKVMLAYSNGSIQEVKWIELDLKYSKLTIGEGKALAILSRYSKMNISSASSVVTDSKYDTYEFGRLTNLVANAAYGHFTVTDLTGKLQIDSKYTDVLVDRIPANFESIRITNSYGTFRLGIDPTANYRINAYSKYCSVVYPENQARVNRFNENNEMKVNGVIGNQPNAKAEVHINSHYGNIRLLP